MTWFWLADPHVDKPALALEQLQRLLAWEPVPDLFQALLAYYQERCGVALTGCVDLVRDADEQAGTALAEALDALPDAAFDRLVTAPETFSLLAGLRGSDPEQVAAILSEAIEAERARRDGKRHPPEAVWTALGDSFTAPDGQRYHAPRLGGRIPVDLVSPQVERAQTPRCGELVALESMEAQRILMALGRAYDGLAAVPAAAALVDAFTAVVVVRKDTADPDVFRSSSTNACPGQTLLVNAHLDSATPVALADALLHEAIHSLLYRWEQVAPFITDSSVADIRLESPWTHNTLELPTYLHAFAVWQGLAAFWADVAPKGAYDVGQAHEKGQMAASGFDGQHAARLAPVQHGLSPTIRALVGSELSPTKVQ